VRPASIFLGRYSRDAQRDAADARFEDAVWREQRDALTVEHKSLLPRPAIEEIRRQPPQLVQKAKCREADAEIGLLDGWILASAQCHSKLVLATVRTVIV
jgi:hypothetical protein